ncbi:hypothetical protein DFH07DRAFT_775490 [Mycena maculata]|uniref:Uncharacterized protein n=1 Tax=Mycena maculata TaxID=230809 RepID=A0AAD7IV19_9AGAR|nr:hypothetical protein DFH07DRAFT_775490 [Mycena maculata]
MLLIRARVRPFQLGIPKFNHNLEIREGSMRTLAYQNSGHALDLVQVFPTDSDGYACQLLKDYSPTVAIQALFLLFSGLCAQFFTGYATLPQYPSEALPLNEFFNNKAATSTGGRDFIADFDGAGAAYDGQFSLTGSWEYDSLTAGSNTFQFSLPSTWDETDDNVLAAGQVLRLQKPTFVHELHFLYAGGGTGARPVANSPEAPMLSVFSLKFATIRLIRLTFMRRIGPAEYHMYCHPYHFEGTKKNLNATNIQQWSTSVPLNRSPFRFKQQAIVYMSLTQRSLGSTRAFHNEMG